MILKNGFIPMMGKITSMKELAPFQQKRLKDLKEIFRKEGRIPLGTSIQEMKYLFRLETSKRHYQRRRQLAPVIKKRTPDKSKYLKEWKEALESAYPSWDHTIEDEGNEESEK